MCNYTLGEDFYGDFPFLSGDAGATLLKFWMTDGGVDQARVVDVAMDLIAGGKPA